MHLDYLLTNHNTTKMSKTPQRRKRRNVNPRRKKDVPFSFRLFTIIIIFIPIIFIPTLIAKKEKVINYLIECNTYKIKPSDTWSKKVFDAVNYNNQIIENANLKSKLLALMQDEFLWFNTKKKKSDTLIEFKSAYSNFYFVEPPILDFADDSNNSYEIRAYALYKYRNPDKEKDGNLFVIENTLSIITNGKISQIKPIEGEKSKLNELDWINHLYKNYELCSVMSLISISFILALLLFIISNILYKNTRIVIKILEIFKK